jgi:hypothetical protein
VRRVDPKPQASTRGEPVAVVVEAIERLDVVLGLGYEAAWALADRGRADWSVLGAPIDEALCIVRRLRDEARRAA